MKAALTTPRRPIFRVNSEWLSMIALLVVASGVAVAAGLASSLLFFGLLLVFALLLLISRSLSRAGGKRGKWLPH
jgi:hypothetical protein